MDKANPDFFKYVALPIIDTEEDFIREVYDGIMGSPEECLYAIYDKTTATGTDDPHSNYAGICALSATSPVNASTEMGAMIFPEFQRTHVATNAIGLLLLWTLDPPVNGGLGLRRVEWKPHADNAASRSVAVRMGFEFEGIARWIRVFPRAEAGLSAKALEIRNGTKAELPGRHSAIYSIVWDEWNDKRPKVLALMERKR